MATHLDLQEQEQLDALKALWDRYGGLVMWTAILAFGALAAYNGWNLWQNNQALKAGAMYDELDRAAQAGDAAKAARVFADLRERYARSTFAEQGGLLAAKAQHDKGDVAGARASLAWVAENAAEDEYRSVARLRLAGLLADEKKYDEALKALDGATAKAFEALVADRRGDILIAMGKRDDAKAAYRKAWDQIGSDVNYRSLIEAKLTALGAAPTPPAGAAAAPAAGASR